MNLRTKKYSKKKQKKKQLKNIKFNELVEYEK